MRRHVIVLVILLIAAGAIYASEYPEEFMGPPAALEGCIDVEAYVTEFIDREPWSIPSPEEHLYWLGMLCVDGGVAVLEFQTIASRICTLAENGLDCIAWFGLAIRIPDRHVMAWDGTDELGMYISSVFSGEVWLFDALTVGEDGVMTFRQGAFEWVPPFWFEVSDERSLWVFDVRPREVQLFGVPIRRATRALR